METERRLRKLMVSKKMFLPRAVSVPSSWANKVNAKAHLQAEGGSEKKNGGLPTRPYNCKRESMLVIVVLVDFIV